MTTGDPGSAAAATITGDAPAQTLNLTIPRGDAGAGGGGGSETFSQSRWQSTDFASAASAAGIFPFVGSAVSAGTIAAQTSGPSDPLFGAIALRDSATAGGGYQLATAAGLFANVGFAFRCVFRTPGVATATARIGFSNSIGTALANNFAYVEIVGATATFRARRNAASAPEVVDPEPFALVPHADYVLDIDIVSPTNVRFVIWNLSDGTVVHSWTATTAAWPNPGTSSIFPAIRATESTTSAATDILVIDYIGFGPARPASCAVPAV